jgi:curved DNA-binding protein CbpA
VATHYDVLGVAPDATAEEIQRAYRLLALRHHPDVAPDADQTAMAAINGAWEVLGDPGRRQVYDASIRAPEAPPAPVPPPAADWEPLAWDDDDDVDPEDLSDEPYAPAGRKPGDMLVMTPVLLVVMAVAVFFFSIMSGSEALRTFAILLLPVSGLGFVMAPLCVMLRSRSRSGSAE